MKPFCLKSVVFPLLTILLPALLLPSPAVAQATYTAQLRGTVKDSTGAVVPKATVNISNPSTQVSETVTTDEVGRYIFPALKPAFYTVKVGAAGFKTIIRSNVELRVNQQTDLDFTLERVSAVRVLEAEAQKRQRSPSQP
jgi:Carboxypeptidase regulatory-like domain